MTWPVGSLQRKLARILLRLYKDQNLSEKEFKNHIENFEIVPIDY